MAQDSGRDALLAALEVRCYTRRAVVIGAAVAVGVTVFFLGFVAGGRTQAPIWFYPSLAFVVFATASMLTLTLMIARRVLWLSVHPAAIVRRAATGGLVAGLLWLVAATGLGLDLDRSLLVEVSLPWAAVLSPLGLWSVHTRYKRVVRLRPVLSGAAIGGLLGALVMADLAAFDLVGLLGVGPHGFDADVVRLFSVGAAGLVGSQAVLGVLAWLGDPAESVVPAVLMVPALVGVTVWGLLGPGRLALVGLGIGLGTAWTGACWRLRRVENADVPTGPDPWA